MFHERKFNFYTEAVYGIAGSAVRPTRFKRVNMEKPPKKWSAENIIQECLRVNGHCDHIASPAPPAHVDGLFPEIWLDRLRTIEATAKTAKVTYKKGGKVFERRRKKDTPVILVGVASYPGAVGPATDQRDQWQRLVIEAARARWGTQYLGALAHTDESCYHLHLLVDADGHPVKPLHRGHEAALRVFAAGGSRREAGAAYHEGCKSIQSWFHENVGVKLGWERKLDRPRIRRSRAGHLATKAAELEAREAALNERQRKLDQYEAAFSEKQRQIQINTLALDTKRERIESENDELRQARVRLASVDKRLTEKEIEMSAERAVLAGQRAAIRDQAALEKRMSKAHPDS